MYILTIIRIYIDNLIYIQGLAVIHKDHPEEIVVACNGSPMVIGLGTYMNIYCTGIHIAIHTYVDTYICIKISLSTNMGTCVCMFL
jgi:glucosamine 6-phosphate synthetase-like amidotransferase/phosphosugar isomerase protein